MAYWPATPKDAFISADPDADTLWGDRPADIFDEALRQITVDFLQNFDRKPTKDELRAGLEFSLRALDT